MQLRAEQLASHLGKTLAPLYILHGNEPLLVLEAADALRAAARRQGFDEREVLVVGQGFKWDALTLASGNLSLFGSRKVIDLRIPTGKPGRDGGDALARHAQRAASSAGEIITLITLPELDWATRKTAWVGALEKAGLMIELNAPELARLPDWIAERLSRQQQRAPREALEFIAQRVEGNLLAAHQEIQKLGLLHPAGDLTAAQVSDAVLNVARYDVDKLRAAFLSGDIARCARLLEGLRGEGCATPLVLWALSSELHALAAVRSAIDAGQSPAQALKNERVFDDRRGQAISRAAARLTSAALRVAVLQAARIDRMIKGLASGDVWDEFLQLTLRLAIKK